jgi:hypothetical protein
MRALHIEGLANHDGSESCVGVREDDGEALTGVRVGRAIEPRNHQSGVPTPSPWRKATPMAALSQAAEGPARSKNLCMHGVSVRENREVPRSPVRLIVGWAAQGRPRPYA